MRTDRKPRSGKPDVSKHRARKTKDAVEGKGTSKPGGRCSGGSVARFGGRLSAAHFRIGQVVSTPTAVCESGQARIVGMEWGPAHGRAKTDCSGWLYWLVEVGRGGEAWAAGESELVKWKEWLIAREERT